MFGFRYRDDLHTGQMSGESASVGALEDGDERRMVCRWACSSPPSSPGRRGTFAPLRWAVRDMVAACFSQSLVTVLGNVQGSEIGHLNRLLPSLVDSH